MGRPPPPPPEAAAAVLARCLGGRPNPDFTASLALFRNWPAVVGPQIAQRTRPYALQRGVLWVASETSTWQNELSLMRPQLIARLNEVLGARIVVDIKVRCEVAPPPGAPPPPLPAPDAGDWQAGRAYAEKIGDAEVRAAFAALVAGHRARRRRPDIGPADDDDA